MGVFSAVAGEVPFSSRCTTKSLAKKSPTGSLPPAVPLAITPTFRPLTHTSDGQLHLSAVARCSDSYCIFTWYLVGFICNTFPCIPVCLYSSCPFVCAAICYSQQVQYLYVLPSILWYVFFLLVSFVPSPISELFCLFVSLVFFFFVALVSRVAFFCCALVPGTLALDLPTLIL